MTLRVLCNVVEVIRHAIRPSVGATSSPAADVDLDELAERLRDR